MVVLPLNPDDVVDTRLIVIVWPCDTTRHELFFYYQDNEIDQAIRFAWTVATDWRDIAGTRVVDPWGMELARFTAAWIYLGKDKFNDKRLGKRSSQPEIGSL